MSDPNTVKILIAGDVRGNLPALYKRVEAVNASPAGPFTALFCVGNFFGESPAAADGDGTGARTTTRRTRGSGRTSTAPSRHPSRRTSSTAFPTAASSAAIRPASSPRTSPSCAPQRFTRSKACASPRCPGGTTRWSTTTNHSWRRRRRSARGEYRAADVRTLLRSNATTETNPGGVVDLLLTNEWPRGCDHNATAAPGDAVATASAAGSPAISDVARDVQPRYHVCGTGGCHYAREPYKNPRGHATRLVALAPVGNDRKERWLHALALLPAAKQPPSALQQLPPDTTRNPYDAPPHGGPNGSGKNVNLYGRGEEFNHAGIRWEEPKAKKARMAGNVRTDPLRGDPDKTVFVRNLNFRADEGALAEFFAQCGELADLRLGRDNESGRSRGFCHVAYTTTEAAEKALELNETTFYGRDIVVHMAKSEEERNADRDKRRAEKWDRPAPPPPGGCWFCLSNEKDTHLVASIATESFVAMDKGGVVPDHCQVVPVEHVPSFAALSPSAADEIWKYLGAIRKCFRAGGGGAPVPTRRRHAARRDEGRRTRSAAGARRVRAAPRVTVQGW